jgi:hypothetical protein
MDSMLLGVFSGVAEYLFVILSARNIVAARRGINPAAFNYLSHNFPRIFGLLFLVPTLNQRGEVNMSVSRESTPADLNGTLMDMNVNIIIIYGGETEDPAYRGWAASNKGFSRN